MSYTPKITVVTVIYNAENTIANCLKSVSAQTYTNVEHIIIDGVSNDKSLAIIEANKAVNVKVFSEPDTGIYNAMNKGIEKATGEYIIFLNADDCYASPTVLNNMVDFLLLHQLDAVSAGVKIYKTGNKKPYRIYKATHFKKWMFILGHQPPHPGFLCSKKAIVNNAAFKDEFFNEQFKIAGDFDLMLRLIYKAKVKWKTMPIFAVNMLYGGASSGSISKTKLLNKEVLQSLKNNHLLSSKFLVYCKYFFKVFQLRG